MSARDEWRDWPARSVGGVIHQENDDGPFWPIWWLSMAYAVGLLIFRLMQITGAEISI